MHISGNRVIVKKNYRVGKTPMVIKFIKLYLKCISIRNGRDFLPESDQLNY